jgi:hypothetical protein
VPPAEIVPALLPSPPIGGAASDDWAQPVVRRNEEVDDEPLYVTGSVLQADQAPSVAVPLDPVPVVVVVLPVGVE